MKRILALLLSLTLLASVTAGCSKTALIGSAYKILVAGCSGFAGNFSPLFAENENDRRAAELTAVKLLSTDREGAVVERGKTGETRAFRGTEYTYEGPADVTVKTHKNGTADYVFDLRDDMKFSDSEKLTADDVLFTMYVLCDPTYDGPSAFGKLPIAGLDAYRKGTESLFSLLVKAGRDNKKYTHWDAATQQAFWTELDAAGVAFAQGIIDYCKTSGFCDANDSVAKCAEKWNYNLKKDATAKDFFAAMETLYDGDYAALSAAETKGTNLPSLFSYMEHYATYAKGVTTGKGADTITGIKKTGKYALTVTLNEYRPEDINAFCIDIVPMHYYGKADKFDLKKHQYGFTKGDLASMREKGREPLGAGPYKVMNFEKGTVYFESNDYYYLGAPKTKNFQLTTDAEDSLNSIVNGYLDITAPYYSAATASAIAAYNQKEENKENPLLVAESTVPEYASLCVSAKRMTADGKNGSDASKSLRKAFLTLFSVYREESVAAYYGAGARVVNYPVCEGTWAAPQPDDADYHTAFATDSKGKDLYKKGMTQEEKEAAALQAALDFFKAAGYTVKDGKVTAPPKGGRTEFELWVAAGGTGDHPAYAMLTKAQAALSGIGITLNIKDMADETLIFKGIEEEQADMWCTAWEIPTDPGQRFYDMYYAVRKTQTKGAFSDHFDIEDAKLNDLLLQGRSGADREARKKLYKDCFAIVADWAVELPLYQRKTATVFSGARVKKASVIKDATAYHDWLTELDKIELK